MKNYIEYLLEAFMVEETKRDDIRPWQDESGVTIMGLLDFLLDPSALN